MIKAIQKMACSTPGFLSNRLKPRHNLAALFFVSIPRPLPPSASSSVAPSTFSGFSVFPAVSTRKIRGFAPFRMSSTHSDLHSDSASSSSSSSPESRIAGNVRGVNFCQSCGGETKHEIPDGEERLRAICTSCGKIAYQNPKMVVGCLIEHENKILLCKRNIQPSYGLWTLPAGYMEIGESAAEGAIRETQEEAGADVEVLSPFAQLDIPLIGQTYIIFLARLKKAHFSPGPESIDCRLFDLDEIPFDSLAFSSMLVTLKLYLEDIKAGGPKFHYGTINKRPGTSPSDIQAFSLDHHLHS